ncbi:MAG: hypothetical protein L0H12_01580 [Nitrosospira sp.]|nr:hypothetical protein [Nitrosospira sp.]
MINLQQWLNCIPAVVPAVVVAAQEKSFQVSVTEDELKNELRGQPPDSRSGTANHWG